MNPEQAPGPRADASAPSRRIALILNPAAGHGRDHHRIERAIAGLDRRSALTVVSPGSGEATERAAREAAGTHEIVIAAGGDGTAHRVINGLVHTGTAMGLLPIGTGNDFARAFAIPADPERAAARVLDGTPVPVDLVQVNGRYFATVGVLGIGADSAVAVSRWMSAAGVRGAVARRLGGWTYRLAALRQLLRRRAATIALGVSLDGGTPGQPRDLHAAFIANTALTGGGLRLPVDVTPDDGRFELCLVPRLPRARLLWAFLCLSQGWTIPDGVLLTSRGSSARIITAEPIVFAADGEVVCTDCSFTLTAHRHALRVIC